MAAAYDARSAQIDSVIERKVRAFDARVSQVTVLMVNCIHVRIKSNEMADF